MSDATETRPKPLSLLERLRATASVFMRACEHRAELAALELGEAKDEAVALSVMSVLGAVAALLSGFALNLLVAAIWWDSPARVLAVSLALAIQVLIAVTAFVVCMKRLRRWRPFDATAQQLKKDSQCLNELFQHPPPRSPAPTATRGNGI